MTELVDVPRTGLATIRTRVLSLATAPDADVLTDGYRTLTEVRTAYQEALQSRDIAAAHLVRHRGWTLDSIAWVMCGHRHHTRRAGVIVAWTEAPEVLPDAESQLYQSQADASHLRELLSRTAAVISDGLRTEAGGLPVPGTDPILHLLATEERMQRVRTFRDACEAARNVVGATLVARHGWRLRQVAAIAGADPGDIAAAYVAAELTSPSFADSDALRELSALTAVLDAEAERLDVIWQDAAAEAHRPRS